MATYAYTFQSGDGVTPTRLNDARTVSAIQTADISDAQITAAKLASNAVETAKILDANVTTAKIADSAVTTAKINDSALTQAKLAANVVGNGPAFRAHASGTTSLPNNTATKVDLATENFDTNSNFASSRFTPTVAGYYQINASVYVTAAPQFLRADIYKNGSQVAGGVHTNQQTYLSNVSDLIYMNGTTDYVELYATQASGTTQAATAVSVGTFMSGFLARAA
jgi:hypothetical protein